MYFTQLEVRAGFENQLLQSCCEIGLELKQIAQRPGRSIAIVIGLHFVFSGVFDDVQARNQRPPAIDLAVRVWVHAPLANGAIQIACVKTGSSENCRL